MRVIPPLEITNARLTSSSVAEPSAGESVYSTATTYAKGQRAISTTAHRVYESLKADNLNHPLPVLPETANEWWFDVGPTNKMAMFDLLRNSQTEAASPLTVTLTPGVRMNALALLGMVADTVEVTVTSGGQVVYTHTETLGSRETLGWYDYFFGAFKTRPSMVLWDLPPYTNAVVTVKLTRAAGNVKCGACVIGTWEEIGAVQYDAENDVLNFSRIDRDAFGNSQLLPRRNVPKTVQNIITEKSRVNKIRALRDQLNAVPAVWSGLDDDTDGYFESLFILGIYKRFSINLAHPRDAQITLELEEI